MVIYIINYYILNDQILRHTLNNQPPPLLSQNHLTATDTYVYVSSLYRIIINVS